MRLGVVDDAAVDHRRGDGTITKDVPQRVSGRMGSSRLEREVAAGSHVWVPLPHPTL